MTAYYETLPSIKISGGHVIDPANHLDKITDVYIVDGVIESIGESPKNFFADQHVDATGLTVCPGFVDLSTTLREPGKTQKGNIYSETRAAASTGITTLCCPPDTTPILDTPAIAHLIRDKSESAGFSRVLPVGAMTQGLEGEKLSAMYGLKEAGCIAVGNSRHPIQNTRVLRRCYEYAATHDMTVFISAMNADLTNHGIMHEGATSTRLGLAGIPETAETVAIATSLLLIEQSGVKAHFCQVSCARGAQMIAEAQDRGLPVSMDVALQNLMFIDEDITGFENLLHSYPPVRSASDREGLRQALRSGAISCLCSHHKPHEHSAKQEPFASTAPGMSTLDIYLPCALSLVEEGLVSLNTLIERLTIGPARAISSNAGTLSIGSLADLCIFDPCATWELTPEKMLSEGKNVPFLHQTLKGKNIYTFLEGRLIYQDSEYLNQRSL